MPHPFMKMFERALAKSTVGDDVVYKQALKLKDKGYSPDEIYRVLTTLKNGMIADTDKEILTDAVEKFSEFVDLDDE